MVQESDIQEQVNSVDWTLIAKLDQKSGQVNVRFKILKKGKTRIVTVRASGRKHEISDCIIGDSSATIKLTLWNDDIDIVEPDRTYELINGFINLFDECMSLSRGRHGGLVESQIPIDEVNELVDMSRPFMGKPQLPKKPRSSTGRTFQGAAGRETKGYCARKSF